MMPRTHAGDLRMREGKPHADRVQALHLITNAQ